MTKKFKLKKDPKSQEESRRYDNPIASREFILQYFKFEAKPLGIKDIERQFSINSKQQKIAIERRLKAMLRDGQLLLDRTNNYVLVANLKLIKSKVYHNKDLGFHIVTENEHKVPLQNRFHNIVFSGDTVLIKVLPANIHGQKCAILVEVLERVHKTVTGLYQEKKGVGYIEPSLKSFKTNVVVSKNDVGAKAGQYVVATITNYPEGRSLFCVVDITEVLGDSTVAGVELNVALSAHDIPHTWPEEIYPEVASLSHSIPAAEIANRKDLRNLPFVTIDGEDSRDFDDAIYALRLQNGDFTLYVAIADVSYYVTPGSAFDNEAKNRATSVYFPREVVPMLPEALSNDLCSLVPNQDRLAMVAKIQLNSDGSLSGYEFCRAVINSHARLTYTKAFKMLQGEMKIPSWLEAPLRDADALYHLLAKIRKNRDAIEFNTPETKLLFNSNGKIDKIIAISRNRAHLIIEECMLLANNVTALFLEKNNCPTLYRVHAKPEQAKIEKLYAFLANFNIKFKADRVITAAEYNKIMRQVKGESYEHIVNIMLLRTMQQAVYQPDNIGHFGLCYKDYLHFTSPIRRYPDLIVHRCIASIINNDKKLPTPYSHKRLIGLGELCSVAERRAEMASRDVVAWLKCCYMQDKLGEIYAGTVSSVTNFGLFVEIDNIFVDGLVHISSLDNDYYDYDSNTNSLIARRANKKFRIGDRLKVKIAKVDINAKFIDFEPIFK